MFKSHLHRASLNKLAFLPFLIIVFLPLIDLSQLLIWKLKFGSEFHPAFSSFLTGTSRYHITQILLIWFLPIYLLILISDDATQDKQLGYKRILINKVGKKKYIFEKLFTSFCVSYLVVFFALIINLLISSIVFYGGDFKRGYEDHDFNHLIYQLGVTEPYFTYLIFLVIFCFCAGVIGSVGAAFSLYFYEKKYSYSATFFLWIAFIFKNDSLVYNFQPFTEYGLDKMLPTLCLFVITSLAIISIIAIVEVRSDEI